MSGIVPSSFIWRLVQFATHPEPKPATLSGSGKSVTFRIIGSVWVLARFVRRYTLSIWPATTAASLKFRPTPPAVPERDTRGPQARREKQPSRK